MIEKISNINRKSFKKFERDYHDVLCVMFVYIKINKPHYHDDNSTANNKKQLIKPMNHEICLCDDRHNI